MFHREISGVNFMIFTILLKKLTFKQTKLVSYKYYLLITLKKFSNARDMTHTHNNPFKILSCV